MPHKVGKKWKWGNVERDSKEELVKVVYGIWAKDDTVGKNARDISELESRSQC